MTDQRTPDKSRNTTVLVAVAAMSVIVMTAAAAGHAVFGGHGAGDGAGTDQGLLSSPRDDNGDEDQAPGTGSAIEQEGTKFPFGAGQDAAAGIPEAEGVATAGILHARDQDLAADAAAAITTAAADAAQRQGGALLARLTSEGAQDSTPFDDAENTAAQAAETKEVAFSLINAIADVWNTLFTDAWPFLRGVGSGTWTVLKDGSSYTPPAE